MYNLKRSILLGIIILSSVAFARADVIKGRVVDNANHPIPNAEVRVPFQGTGTKAQRMSGTVLHTDAQGFFSADIAPMDSGNYGMIYAVAPGMAVKRLLLNTKDKDQINTFQLQPAEMVSGRVLDQKGKPVANVSVQLQGFSVKSTLYPTLYVIGLPWENRYRTLTDKNGHWQLKGVPHGSQANMVVLDPRYVTQNFDASPGAPLLIKVRPGATFSGRVVDASNMPVANVEVMAQQEWKANEYHNSESKDTTAADGSYRLTGLPSGTYDISVNAGDLPLVAAIIKGQSVHEGKTEEIRNLVLTPGGIITGRVLDKKTGAPGKYMFVNSYASRDPQSIAGLISAEPDINGYYTLRVPPGIRYVSPVGGEGEYTHINNNVVTLTVQKGQTVTQNFELNSGDTLSGVVVDQQGKPVAGVQIMVNQLSVANASEFSGSGDATTDANGRWKVATQVSGPVEIYVKNPWYIPDSSPITLPHQGEVRITVGNINDLPPVGRVVDIHHKPLKGIIVQLTYEGRHGESGTSIGADAYSDANGYLHVQPVQFDAPYKFFSANFDNISNSNYAFVSGGKWNAKTATFSDIVLDHLDNIVHGRVLNKQGKPAPGVRVEAAGYDKAVTKTDKAGNFALSGLPHQNVTLLAIGKQTVGKLTLPSGSWAILHLAALPANHFPTRAQVFDKLEKLYRTDDKKDFTRSLIVSQMIKCNAPRTLNLLKDINEKLSFQSIYNVIDALSKNNPTLALQWGGQHLAGVIKGDDRILVLCQLTKLAVGRDDNLAQKYFSEAEILAQKNPAPVQKTYIPFDSTDKSMDQFLYNHIYLAGAAAKMHPEKTNKWLMQMLDYSMVKDQKSPLNFDYIRGEMAAELCMVAPQQTALLIQNSSAISAAAELEFATSAAARAGKLDLALHWLNQLRALCQSDNTSTSKLKPSDGDPELAGATLPVIKLIGPKNPAKALELARMITDNKDAAQCLMLAATYQSKPIALSVLSELFKDPPQTNFVNSPRIAAMIYNIDPAKGKELFDQLLKKYQQQQKMFSSDRNVPVGDGSLAYYMARCKPLASWEILQKAHAKSKQQPLQDISYGSNYSQIILAMSALNFDEAMRWARELSPQTSNFNVSDNTQFNLLQIALASPQARSTLDLYNPGTSDS